MSFKQRVARFSRSNLWMIFVFVGWLFATCLPLESFAQARKLPDQKIAFFYKDRPFRETMQVLCVHVKLKCVFAKDADTDMTYIIEVESLRWDTVFMSALNAYKFNYRWIDDSTIEIYQGK